MNQSIKDSQINNKIEAKVIFHSKIANYYCYFEGFTNQENSREYQNIIYKNNNNDKIRLNINGFKTQADVAMFIYSENCYLFKNISGSKITCKINNKFIFVDKIFVYKNGKICYYNDKDLIGINFCNKNLQATSIKTYSSGVSVICDLLAQAKDLQSLGLVFNKLLIKYINIDFADIDTNGNIIYYNKDNEMFLVDINFHRIKVSNIMVNKNNEITYYNFDNKNIELFLDGNLVLAKKVIKQQNGDIIYIGADGIKQKYIINGFAIYCDRVKTIAESYSNIYYNQDGYSMAIDKFGTKAKYIEIDYNNKIYYHGVENFKINNNNIDVNTIEVTKDRTTGGAGLFCYKKDEKGGLANFDVNVGDNNITVNKINIDCHGLTRYYNRNGAVVIINGKKSAFHLIIDNEFFLTDPEDCTSLKTIDVKSLGDITFISRLETNDTKEDCKNTQQKIKHNLQTKNIGDLKINKPKISSKSFVNV